MEENYILMYNLIASLSLGVWINQLNILIFYRILNYLKRLPIT